MQSPCVIRVTPNPAAALGNQTATTFLWALPTKSHPQDRKTPKIPFSPAQEQMSQPGAVTEEQDSVPDNSPLIVPQRGTEAEQGR